MPSAQRIIARFVQASGGLLMRVPRELHFPELGDRPPDVVSVPTKAGPVRCHLYRPAAESRTPGVYVNFHGGGYVVRHPEFDDHICRYVSAHAACVVVNVDYDVAPQRPFPVATTQAYDVCAWAARDGAGMGWDGDRLAVGGQSAGGGLAAGVCLTARDRGEFAPRLQVLAYPPLDLSIDPAEKRSPIARPLINPFIANVFNAAYTPDPATRTDPLVSPALAKNLRGLPPALILTAEHDTLREEGDRYARALDDAGVPVVHQVMPGVDHGFTHRLPASVAKEAITLIADHVREALD
jgi:acetyl esterase